MAADLKDARKRSVDNLQRLYTFVISLAVAESLRRTLLSTTGNAEFIWSNKWVMSLSLIVTVIPFYHGANRYLDATYVTDEREAKRYGLMIDFFFFFIHAFGMFILALLITNDPSLIATNDTYFFYGLAGLLVLDVIWVTVALFAITVRRAQKELPYWVWAPINIVTVIIMYFLIRNMLWGWLLTLLTLRSIVDYILAHKFYYPDKSDAGT